jgi:metal-dependent amidase/aminoacylase/carboxypeptidase family protein
MWTVEYQGSPAHAAVAPHRGVNALDALVVAQTAIALARQQLPPESIVSVIVTEGGSAVNVIPERSVASVEMRAPTLQALRIVQSRIRACLEAGALASGCALITTPIGNDFAELQQDPYLMEAYRHAMAKRGRVVGVGTGRTGSTDMGNVSQRVPSLHAMLGYEIGDAVHHTAEFAAYGASESADAAILDGAFALAVTGALAATNPAQRARLQGGRGAR